MNSPKTISEWLQQKEAHETADFDVQNCGSIFIINPLSPAGEEWLTEHLPADVQTWGGFGRVIEHRYVRDIVDGMLEAGLLSTQSPR